MEDFNVMNLKRLRQKAGMNQTEFWNRVGVTQSAGSRYESGRAIPKPVQMLIAIAYGKTQERHGTLNKLWSATK